VVDCTNPIAPDLKGLTIGTTTSAGEQVAQWARGAMVVKAFNTSGSGNMANPLYESQPVTMFICGDDDGAKERVAQLAKEGAIFYPFLEYISSNYHIGLTVAIISL
jgi:predicted dinucleotide-binding enzyme